MEKHSTNSTIFALRSRYRSFTLIELLVVVLIIGILAGLLLPVLSGVRRKARYARWVGYAHQMRGDDRLLVYYTFEDGNGSSNVDNKSVGAGLPWIYQIAAGHGTLSGGLKISTENSRWPGLKGGVYFPGLATQLFSAPNFGWPNDGTMEITVLYWIQVKTAEVNNGEIFTIGNLDNPNRCTGASPWGDKVLYWDHGTWSGNGRLAVDFKPYLDKWTHVALVSSGLGGNFKGIYINGTLMTSYTVGVTTVSDGPTANLSGVYLGQFTTYYNQAQLDEFAAYARVLSADEIMNHYLAGKP